MTRRGAGAAAAGRPHDRDSFYRAVLARLNAARRRYLVGGAYGLTWATGIATETKDLDLFVRPRDCQATLDLLADAGYRTETPFPHWLAKVRWGDDVIDVIFNSGNGESPVDDEWFAHALPAELYGQPVRICPIEEMIWTKAFVMERERYDGADVAHLLHACAEHLDWPRLLDRFGPHWPVLLSHLVLFRYVYPGEAGRIPAAVMERLVLRLRSTRAAPADRTLCRGVLLSRCQFLVDILDWGYRDARLPPHGHIGSPALAIWTEAAPDRPQAADATPIRRCVGPAAGRRLTAIRKRGSRARQP